MARPTITEEQLENDTLQLLLWKTVQLIKQCFKYDYKMFYETFQWFKRLKSQLQKQMFKKGIL